MKPEVIAQSLPATATDAEIRQAAETAVKGQPVTYDSIRGLYQVWNDFHNGNESLPVETEELTLADILAYLPTWVEWETEYIAEQVKAELRE